MTAMSELLPNWSGQAKEKMGGARSAAPPWLCAQRHEATRRILNHYQG